MDYNALSNTVQFSIKTNDLENLQKEQDYTFSKIDNADTCIDKTDKNKEGCSKDLSLENIAIINESVIILDNRITETKKPTKRNHEVTLENISTKSRKIEDQLIIEPETSSILVINSLSQSDVSLVVTEQQSMLKSFIKATNEPESIDISKNLSYNYNQDLMVNLESYNLEEKGIQPSSLNHLINSDTGNEITNVYKNELNTDKCDVELKSVTSHTDSKKKGTKTESTVDKSIRKGEDTENKNVKSNRKEETSDFKNSKSAKKEKNTRDTNVLKEGSAVLKTESISKDVIKYECDKDFTKDSPIKTVLKKGGDMCDATKDKVSDKLKDFKHSRVDNSPNDKRKKDITTDKDKKSSTKIESKEGKSTKDSDDKKRKDNTAMDKDKKEDDTNKYITKAIITKSYEDKDIKIDKSAKDSTIDKCKTKADQLDCKSDKNISKEVRNDSKERCDDNASIKPNKNDGAAVTTIDKCIYGENLQGIASGTDEKICTLEIGSKSDKSAKNERKTDIKTDSQTKNSKPSKKDEKKSSQKSTPQKKDIDSKKDSLTSTTAQDTFKGDLHASKKNKNSVEAEKKIDECKDDSIISIKENKIDVKNVESVSKEKEYKIKIDASKEKILHSNSDNSKKKEGRTVMKTENDSKTASISDKKPAKERKTDLEIDKDTKKSKKEKDETENTEVEAKLQAKYDKETKKEGESKPKSDKSSLPRGYQHSSKDKHRTSSKKHSTTELERHNRIYRSNKTHKSHHKSKDRRYRSSSSSSSNSSSSSSPRRAKLSEERLQKYHSRRSIRSLQMGPLNLRDEFLLETECDAVNPEVQLEESFECKIGKTASKNKRSIAEKLQILLSKTKTTDESVSVESNDDIHESLKPKDLPDAVNEETHQKVSLSIPLPKTIRNQANKEEIRKTSHKKELKEVETIVIPLPKNPTIDSEIHKFSRLITSETSHLSLVIPLPKTSKKKSIGSETQTSFHRNELIIDLPSEPPRNDEISDDTQQLFCEDLGFYIPLPKSCKNKTISIDNAEKSENPQKLSTEIAPLIIPLPKSSRKKTNYGEITKSHQKESTSSVRQEVLIGDDVGQFLSMSSDIFIPPPPSEPPENKNYQPIFEDIAKSPDEKVLSIIPLPKPSKSQPIINELLIPPPPKSKPITIEIHIPPPPKDNQETAKNPLSVEDKVSPGIPVPKPPKTQSINIEALKTSHTKEIANENVSKIQKTHETKKDSSVSKHKKESSSSSKTAGSKTQSSRKAEKPSREKVSFMIPIAKVSKKQPIFVEAHECFHQPTTETNLPLESFKNFLMSEKMQSMKASKNPQVNTETAKLLAQEVIMTNISPEAVSKHSLVAELNAPLNQTESLSAALSEKVISGDHSSVQQKETENDSSEATQNEAQYTSHKHIKSEDPRMNTESHEPLKHDKPVNEDISQSSFNKEVPAVSESLSVKVLKTDLVKPKSTRDKSPRVSHIKELERDNNQQSNKKVHKSSQKKETLSDGVSEKVHQSSHKKESLIVTKPERSTNKIICSKKETPKDCESEKIQKLSRKKDTLNDNVTEKAHHTPNTSQTESTDKDVKTSTKKLPLKDNPPDIVHQSIQRKESVTQSDDKVHKSSGEKKLLTSTKPGESDETVAKPLSHKKIPDKSSKNEVNKKETHHISSKKDLGKVDTSSHTEKLLKHSKSDGTDKRSFSSSSHRSTRKKEIVTTSKSESITNDPLCQERKKSDNSEPKLLKDEPVSDQIIQTNILGDLSSNKKISSEDRLLSSRNESNTKKIQESCKTDIEFSSASLTSIDSKESNLQIETAKNLSSFVEETIPLNAGNVPLMSSFIANQSSDLALPIKITFAKTKIIPMKIDQIKPESSTISLSKEMDISLGDVDNQIETVPQRSIFIQKTVILEPLIKTCNISFRFKSKTEKKEPNCDTVDEKVSIGNNEFVWPFIFENEQKKPEDSRITVTSALDNCLNQLSSEVSLDNRRNSKQKLQLGIKHNIKFSLKKPKRLENVNKLLSGTQDVNTKMKYCDKPTVSLKQSVQPVKETKVVEKVTEESKELCKNVEKSEDESTKSLEPVKRSDNLEMLAENSKSLEKPKDESKPVSTGKSIADMLRHKIVSEKLRKLSNRSRDQELSLEMSKATKLEAKPILGVEMKKMLVNESVNWKVDREDSKDIRNANVSEQINDKMISDQTVVGLTISCPVDQLPKTDESGDSNSKDCEIVENVTVASKGDEKELEKSEPLKEKKKIIDKKPQKARKERSSRSSSSSDSVKSKGRSQRKKEHSRSKRRDRHSKSRGRSKGNRRSYRSHSKNIKDRKISKSKSVSKKKTRETKSRNRSTSSSSRSSSDSNRSRSQKRKYRHSSNNRRSRDRSKDNKKSYRSRSRNARKRKLSRSRSNSRNKARKLSKSKSRHGHVSSSSKERENRGDSVFEVKRRKISRSRDKDGPRIGQSKETFNLRKLMMEKSRDESKSREKFKSRTRSKSIEMSPPRNMSRLSQFKDINRPRIAEEIDMKMRQSQPRNVNTGNLFKETLGFAKAADPVPIMGHTPVKPFEKPMGLTLDMEGRTLTEKCIISFLNQMVQSNLSQSLPAQEVPKPYTTEVPYNQLGAPNYYPKPQVNLSPNNQAPNLNYFVNSQQFTQDPVSVYPPICKPKIESSPYSLPTVFPPTYSNFCIPQPCENLYQQSSFGNYSQNFGSVPIAPQIAPAQDNMSIIMKSGTSISLSSLWKSFDETNKDVKTTKPYQSHSDPVVKFDTSTFEEIDLTSSKNSSSSSLSNFIMDMEIASPSVPSIDSSLRLDEEFSDNDDISSCSEFKFEKVEIQDPFEKYADAPRPQYEHIVKTEVHMSAVGKRFEYAYLKSTPCNCVPPNPDEIRMGKAACDENCFNRQIKVECNRSCPVYELCTNRRFQEQMYAPLEPFYSGPAKGWGVRAQNNIPAGTFVIEYVGELIDFKDFLRRINQNMTYNRNYLMVIQKGLYIDAGNKGNWSRFVNHSCNPNTIIERWVVNGKTRIGFFSKKPIYKDEEITIDYQFQQYGSIEQRCYCNSANCTGIMGKINEKLQELIKTSAIRDRNLLIQRIISRKSLTDIRHVSEMMTVIKEECLDRDTFFSFLEVLLRSSSHQCIRTFIECGGLNVITSYLDSVAWNDWSLKLLYLQCLEHFKLKKRTLIKSGYTSVSVVEYWSENPRFELKHVDDDSLNVESCIDDNETVSDSLVTTPVDNDCHLQFALPSTNDPVCEIENQVHCLALSIKEYFKKEKEKFFIPKIKGNQLEFSNELSMNDSESKSISIASSVQGDFVQTKKQKLRKKCSEIIQKLSKEEFRRLFSERYHRSMAEKNQNKATPDKNDIDNYTKVFETIKQLLSSVIVDEVNKLKQNEQFSTMPLEFQNLDIDKILSGLNIVEKNGLLSLSTSPETDSSKLTSGSRSSGNTSKCQKDSSLYSTDQLPPNWRFSRCENGRVYFYHIISKKTQWDTPVYPWDAGENDPSAFDFGDTHLYQVTFDDIKAMHERLKTSNEQEKLEEREKKRKERTIQRKLSLSPGDQNKIKFSREVFKSVKSILKPFFIPSCKVGRIRSKLDMKYLCEKFSDTIIGKEVKQVTNLEDLELTSDVLSKMKSYIVKYMSRQGRVYKRSKKTKSKPETANR